MLSSASATEKLKGKKCPSCGKEIISVQIIPNGAVLVHSMTQKKTFFGYVNEINEKCSVDESELQKLIKKRGKTCQKNTKGA